MAPVAPLGRKGAMKLVAAGKIPFDFGSPHPKVAVVEQDGVLRIRALVIDEAEAETARQAALARGGAWMPESYYALGKPTGEIFAEAATVEALLETMQSMDWPDDW
jgi:hypothetical protein